MKKYADLTPEQQEQAMQICLVDVLRDITEEGVYPEGLYTRIQEAWEKAEQMRTPWFIHEYIMDTCEKELREMALQIAQGGIYLEGNEYTVTGRW